MVVAYWEVAGMGRAEASRTGEAPVSASKPRRGRHSKMRISSIFGGSLATLTLCQSCATATHDPVTAAGGRSSSGVSASAGQPDTATGPGGASTSLGGSSMAQAGNAGTATMAGQGEDGPPTTSPVGGSASDCIVTKFHRIIRGRPEFTYEYVRIRYDAAARIETTEYSSKPDFSVVTFVRQALYDESGHVLASIGSDANSGRHDYTYDSAGNETHWGLSDTIALDLTVPAQPPFRSSRESTHTYDALGRLSASTVVHYYSGTTATTNYTYSHDDASRCAVITSNNAAGNTPVSKTETRTYQSDGGIRSEATAVVTSTDSVMTTVGVTELKADALGRWLTVVTDGGSFLSGDADGTPDNARTYSYAADGTITIVSLDFLTDTPNDEIMRDGRLIYVGRQDYTITSQCASMPVSMHKLDGNACRYPLLGWTESIIY